MASAISKSSNALKNTPNIKFFMYVKYPNATEPTIIEQILLENGIELYQSYLIEELISKGPFNGIIIPGGTAKIQQRDLGEVGIEIIKNFVSKGGGYVGFCAGGYLAAMPPSNKPGKPGLGLIKIKYILPDQMMELKGKVLTQLDLPSFQDNLEIPYHNGPIYEVLTDDLTHVEVLGIIKRQDVGWPEMNNKPCILKSRYGDGHVVVCGPHPALSKALNKLTLEIIMQCLDAKLH